MITIPFPGQEITSGPDAATVIQVALDSVGAGGFSLRVVSALFWSCSCPLID